MPDADTVRQQVFAAIHEALRNDDDLLELLVDDIVQALIERDDRLENLLTSDLYRLTTEWLQGAKHE